VGALLDLGADDATRAVYGEVRNRIFALSTVSGSSAGAVVIRAALLDAAERKQSTRPPCETAGSGSWFGQPLMAQDKRYDPKQNWRDCFQAILAGDFLSPVFVALAYRDNFPFINPFTDRPAWADRAVLLEQAFERRYHRFTTQTGRSISCPSQPQADATGLCRPFGFHPSPEDAGAWVPLFLVNGASVYTGRRMLVSDIEPDGNIFARAYDIYDLRTEPRSSSKGKKAVANGTDMRLSTAATMSARFPVISPQGIVRDIYGEVRDQIVDGGYFENDGLATIVEIATALRARQLDPVVIRIVNEPSTHAALALDPMRPPEADPEDRTVFDDVFAIARALISARSGHVEEYEAFLAKRVLSATDRVYDIGVYEFPSPADVPSAYDSAPPRNNPFCRRGVKAKAVMRRVSMSWWMSQPVQAYLDAQLCLRANWDRLECELREGRTGTGASCPSIRFGGQTK
jgi:hypothetical protein